MAALLRAVGVSVVEEDGWASRTQPTTHSFTPIGVLNHHTAPPVPYPVANLMTKVQLNVKPDGTVHVIAAGYQYHAGSGASIVADEAAAGVAPSGRAIDRGLTDDVNGNPFFIGIEVDHAGDGGPLPSVQRAALIDTNAVLCYANGWTANHIVGHAEWTARKLDPYWDGDLWPMPEIRADTADRLFDFNNRVFIDVPDTHFYHDDIAAAKQAGVFGGYPDGTFHPAEPISRAQLAAVLRRLGLTGGG